MTRSEGEGAFERSQRGWNSRDFIAAFDWAMERATSVTFLEGTIRFETRVERGRRVCRGQFGSHGYAEGLACFTSASTGQVLVKWDAGRKRFEEPRLLHGILVLPNAVSRLGERGPSACVGYVTAVCGTAAKVEVHWDSGGHQWVPVDQLEMAQGWLAHG